MGWKKASLLEIRKRGSLLFRFPWVWLAIISKGDQSQSGEGISKGNTYLLWPSEEHAQYHTPLIKGFANLPVSIGRSRMYLTGSTHDMRRISWPNR